MTEDIQKESEARMRKSLAALDEGFGKIRAGRAHPSLLAQLRVEYYGAEVPLAQMANISAEDAQTLKVSLWEKDLADVVEKAIRRSDLGLNPMVAGNIIRVPLPPLSEERRRDLVRIVKDEAEQARVAVRNIRRDANSDIKEWLKAKEISEDAARQCEEAIQKITDAHIQKINEKLAAKEASLLSV